MLAGYIKNFLKTKVAELEKRVLESENKIDDAVWGFFKNHVNAWIDSL